MHDDGAQHRILAAHFPVNRLIATVECAFVRIFSVDENPFVVIYHIASANHCDYSFFFFASSPLLFIHSFYFVLWRQCVIKENISFLYSELASDTPVAAAAVDYDAFDTISSELHDLDTEQSEARYDPRVLSRELLGTVQHRSGGRALDENSDDEQSDTATGAGAHCIVNANRRYEHGDKVRMSLSRSFSSRLVCVRDREWNKVYFLFISVVHFYTAFECKRWADTQVISFVSFAKWMDARIVCSFHHRALVMYTYSVGFISTKLFPFSIPPVAVSGLGSRFPFSPAHRPSVFFLSLSLWNFIADSTKRSMRNMLVCWWRGLLLVEKMRWVVKTTNGCHSRSFAVCDAASSHAE